MKNILLLLTLLAPNFIHAQGLDKRIDQAFEPISSFFSNVIFFKIYDIPFVLMLLVFSALFFTIYFAFPNIRYFKIAINTVRGKYDDLDDKSIKTEDVKGTIKDESKDGEVSHFQALTTAVSGTVGNGNIAGVALAIALGGPGATFWMIICGLLGMSTKFVECTLGVKYRDVGEDGTVFGGPMYYISKGLKERGFELLGKISAVLFAIFCIGGSFGGGNAAQSNQATIVLKDLLGLESTASGAIIGCVIALIVGVIIIGGIKRIATVTEKVVPFMALLYLVACVYIIASNFMLIDDAFLLIITEAFNPTAIGVGSVIGVLLVGFKRAAFSNEAGAGSASIAHSAVKTKYSASEGLVALLEPFIDTVVICTMTALVIIMFNFNGDVNNNQQFAYGAIQVKSIVNYNFEEYESDNGVFEIEGKIYKQDDYGNIYVADDTLSVTTLALINGKEFIWKREENKKDQKSIIPHIVKSKNNVGNDSIITSKDYSVKGKVMIDDQLYEGAGITSKAFAKYIPYSNIFLTIAVFLFAISTMISWSYYGLQSWKFVFGRGRRAELVYKILFLLFIVIGAAASMKSIWDFSDAMIFAMIFPNMIGLFFLFPVVKKELNKYLDSINNN